MSSFGCRPPLGYNMTTCLQPPDSALIGAEALLAFEYSSLKATGSRSKLYPRTINSLCRRVEPVRSLITPLNHSTSQSSRCNPLPGSHISHCLTASIQELFFRPFLMTGIEPRPCNPRVFLNFLRQRPLYAAYLGRLRQASVFTPVRNRGKGREYLGQLEWPSEEWGEKPIVSRKEQEESYGGDALFSALWSDVGPEFYARCGTGIREGGGWQVQDPNIHIWNVDDAHSSTVPGEWEWLNEQEVHDIWKEEAERMKLELEERARESQTSLRTFLPSNGVADFLIDRKRMGWMRMVPKYWDIPHSTAGLDQFATWTIERRKDGSWVMVITRLRGDAEAIIQAIIAGFAKKYGVSAIECWGVGDTERDDHLPCFKWYGPERSTLCFNEK
ncbi:hypothetical protein D9613_012187 [Agrocybe pediades]|uniref:LYC1 C-terminal domain-containing protein n=1 Tax=Agrocybe pediades TaxID=84607 RepID=A0A8H4VVU9_9AGAR|nr:hypothetical protein D9613_012187 [Agrocybe pediades]